MSDLTDLARISCYRDLVEAFAARKAELGLSDEALDAAAGLARGHTGKVLGPARERGIGAATFEALMMALAVDMLMVDNPAKRAEMAPYWEGRKAHNVRTTHRLGKRRFSRAMSEIAKKRVEMLSSGWQASIGKIGGEARARNLNPEQRREIAKAAAAARWRRNVVE